MKAIFSSRGLEANVERSRKLSVDIGKEEKNACVGREVDDNRDWGFRVISDARRAVQDGLTLVRKAGVGG